MRNVENLGEVDLESNPDSSHQQSIVYGLSRGFRNGSHGSSRVRDPYIILRVNQYLNENKDQVYFDINDMVESLRRRYREYRRRNWGQFKILVERAFSIISKNSRHNFNMDLDEGSSSGVEECNDKEAKQGNSSNSQLLNLYQPAQLEAMAKQSGNSAELINLSSDEESAALKQSQKKDKEGTQPGELPGAIRNNVELTVTRHRNFRKMSLLHRLKSKAVEDPSPKTTFADFAGNPKIIEEICELIIHMKHPEAFERIGVSSPRGFLLHGPPGCGKTLLANAVAGQLKVPLIKVSGPEMVGGVSGESEERIRDLFSSAVSSAPCVLFIDEVDAISPNRRTAEREMERRIVAQLLTSLDDLSNVENGDRVLVIGATNQPDSLDPALRRAGRFDREVCLGIPDVAAREQILRHYSKKMALATELDLKLVAQMTPGYVGADLLLLLREAALIVISRVLEEIRVEKESKRSNKRKLAKDNKVAEPVAKKMDTGELNGVLIDDDIIAEDPVPDSNVSSDKAANGTPEIVVDVVAEEEEKKKEEEVIESEMDVVGTDSDDEPVVSFDSSPFVNSIASWLKVSTPLSKKQLTRFCLTQVDVSKALKKVQPSAKREGFATVPDVTWDDIGSLVAVRKHLEMEILGPLKYQAQFESLGLVAPAGVLLCGPPGCGKTLLAKAVANEAGINFISVKGPELLNMYVGESERAVRQVFQRARNSVPCVIFFDELDALCPRRIDGDSGATMRVVNQMLTEMDGVGDRRGVFLMAATNRPDIVDPAVLRPGRLDKTVFVGMPTAEDRADILRTITKNGAKPKLSSEVSLEALASQKELENFTGADLAALVREASMQALKEAISTSASTPEENITVKQAHFQEALRNVRPSVSNKDRVRYEEMRREFAEVPR